MTSPISLVEASSSLSEFLSVDTNPASCRYSIFNETCIVGGTANQQGGLTYATSQDQGVPAISNYAGNTNAGGSSGNGDGSYAIGSSIARRTLSYATSIDSQLSYIGDEVASGDSTFLEVITLSSMAGPIAVAVVPPYNISGDVEFSANTFGMATSCTKTACNHTVNESDSTVTIICQVLALGGDQPNTNTTVTWSGQDNGIQGVAAFYPLQEASNTTSATFDGLAGYGATNPFGFSPLFVFRLPSPSNLESINIDSNALFYSLWSADCKIHIYDVSLAYVDGSYTIQSQQLANENTTNWLVMPFVQEFSNYWTIPKLLNNLKHHVNDTDFSDVVEAQVRQVGLAYSAGTLKRVPTEATTLIPFIGNRYPFPVLGFLWGSAALYIVVAVVLLLNAAFLTGDIVPTQNVDSEQSDEMRTTSTLYLAHQRLSNPIAVIAEHFILSTKSSRHAQDQAPYPIQDDAMAMFPDSRTSTQPRARLGFVSEDDDGLQGKDVHKFHEKGSMAFKIVY